ncbi:MAG: right-handed parallel beta-helix repeat-containing protein [Planctomycetes bacterium]|nr:right-handed parallel beta-helix repeat-containing protein [Planctomycetota bacterium]
MKPLALLVLLLPAPAFQDDPVRGFAIPTFHCLGLYWSPPGAAADKAVTVRYRKSGGSDWKEALAMRYNPIPGTDEALADYRGSIVELPPATSYEVQLSLAGTSTTTTFTAATWSEDFPVGEVVRVSDGDKPLVISESGKPGAYRIYDGRGATIDVRHQHDSCITIDASYVIVRGFTLKGAGSAANPSTKPTGAVVILGGRNIVIEDCDVSDWGRLNPKTGFGVDYESAVYSRSATLKQLVVQRCRLHHPATDSNNWFEPKRPTHPGGPQAISLFNTAGNHVLRYNECRSDLEHMFNDIIGGGSNGSFRGSPGPDSDIYGNVVSHCWDDGLEVEGGNRNTRVWNNYIFQTMMGIGNAATSIGPLYLWRNVVARSQMQPEGAGGNFIKMGYADGEKWMTGHMYIFHNTVYRSDEWLPTGGLGGARIVKHVVSRNNILHVREARNFSLSNNPLNVDNSYDYDLFNGRIPEGVEAHGVRGEPVYAEGSGFDAATGKGSFRLAPGSPGAAKGEVIPNFSDGFAGTAPDLGAHFRGEPHLQYGIRAK